MQGMWCEAVKAAVTVNLTSSALLMKLKVKQHPGLVVGEGPSGTYIPETQKTRSKTHLHLPYLVETWRGFKGDGIFFILSTLEPRQ